MVEPNNLGVVEAPEKGSLSLNLQDVPMYILHTAEVAFKEQDGLAHLTGIVQLDQDEILAIYEVQGKTSNGRLLEADVRPDGTLSESNRKGQTPLIFNFSSFVEIIIRLDEQRKQS